MGDAVEDLPLLEDALVDALVDEFAIDRLHRHAGAGASVRRAENLGERALPHQLLQLVLPHQPPIRPRPRPRVPLGALLLLHRLYRVRRCSRRRSRRSFSGKPRFRSV